MGSKPRQLELYEDFYGCWKVTSHKWKHKKGYSLIKRNGKKWRAHRYMYQKYYGNIPEGMLVCHTCDHPGCVNPKHLFLGTNKDNMRDAINKERMSSRIILGEQRGEDNYNSKLTKFQAKDIKISELPPKELKEKYDISSSQIYRIRHGLRWAHI